MDLVSDLSDDLLALARLLDEGKITRSEYDTIKRDLVTEMEDAKGEMVEPTSASPPGDSGAGIEAEAPGDVEAVCVGYYRGNHRGPGVGVSRLSYVWVGARSTRSSGTPARHRGHR